MTRKQTTHASSPRDSGERKGAHCEAMGKVRGIRMFSLTKVTEKPLISPNADALGPLLLPAFAGRRQFENVLGIIQ